MEKHTPIDQIIFGYIANEERYKDGEAIIKEGSKGDWSYVIIEGQEKRKKYTPMGIIHIDTLKEGDIFGEMLLLQSEVDLRTASVVADGSVRVGILDTERLIREYESISPYMRNIIKSLTKKLKDSTDKAVALVVSRS